MDDEEVRPIAQRVAGVLLAAGGLAFALFLLSFGVGLESSENSWEVPLTLVAVLCSVGASILLGAGILSPRSRWLFPLAAVALGGATLLAYVFESWMSPFGGVLTVLTVLLARHAWVVGPVTL